MCVCVCVCVWGGGACRAWEEGDTEVLEQSVCQMCAVTYVKI